MWQRKLILRGLVLFIGVVWFLISDVSGQATELSLPTTPTCATSADFNGDGNPDLAIGTDGAILIYQGKGDGSFSGPTIVPFGGLPNTIEAADVNGNGLMDLVVSDRKNGKIRILLNNYGEFSSIHTEKDSRAANALAVYEFNADGYSDIALAENNRISIWYGLGDYNLKENSWFMLTNNYPVPTGAISALGRADFDQDGWADLVVTSASGNMVYVFTQLTLGYFNISSQAQTGSNPVALAIADFNQDGVLDLAVANKNSNSVGIFHGSLEGGVYTLKPAIYYPVGYSPSSLSVADFNSDNLLDIAVTCEGENKVYFLLGNKWGNFALSSENLFTGQRPIKIIATDFDSNGKADLITINKGTKTLSLFKDQEFSNQISFKAPELDIKIRKNGEGEPLNGPISINSQDEIEIFGSLSPNDCLGYLTDVYLTFTVTRPTLGEAEAKAETQTYSITADGELKEGVTPFVEDWYARDVSQFYLNFAAQDLINTIGTGFYSIVGKLILKDYAGFVYYVSDSAEFGLGGRPISNPAVVKLKLDTSRQRVKASVSVEANDALGLPAFAYLWIECSGTYQYEEEGDNETEIKTGYIFFTEQYTPGGWEVLENKAYKEGEEREEFTIEPFTVWAVTDLTDYPLFDLPRSFFPGGLSCDVHAGFIVKNMDGMDYTVFDYASFLNY